MSGRGDSQRFAAPEGSPGEEHGQGAVKSVLKFLGLIELWNYLGWKTP